MDKEFEKGFDLFYNYRFDEAIDYFKDKMTNSDDPFPFYAFYSYANIRSDLANAYYDNASENADKIIMIYKPIFENYLKDNPEDVDAQFYYTVLLAGKMRIYLNKMEYLKIMKEAPKILSNKFIIDRQTDKEYIEMKFGTGSFDYYLSVVGGNFGMTNLFSSTKSDGINDLWDAYGNGEFSKWEAAVVLMYIYLYDKMDYDTCVGLYTDFLNKFPDNLEVLSIAAECCYYQERWLEGDKYRQRIQKLIKHGGVLQDPRGWNARQAYLNGVRAMLKDDNIDALNYFNDAYEMDAIEYSWYRSILLKYTADVYLKMGMTRTAKLYYEKAAGSLEISPHVREAKDILKTLK
jgi:tetratricopeptide (TPR) repeat protein